MFLVALLAALALWGVAATLVELRRDGYRAVPTDWSRAIPDDPADAAAGTPDEGKARGGADGTSIRRPGRRPRPAHVARIARPRPGRGRGRAGQLPSTRS